MSPRGKSAHLHRASPQFGQFNQFIFCPSDVFPPIPSESESALPHDSDGPTVSTLPGDELRIAEPMLDAGHTRIGYGLFPTSGICYILKYI
jgi:hypothetical protein